MAIHVTGTGAVPVSTTTPGLPVRGIRITVNTGFSGTITTVDGSGTIGIATNPAVGNSFIYDGLLSPVTVTNSAAGDTTISLLNSHT